MALRCADRSGSREIRIPALGNLAFIKLAQHKLGDVRTYLLELTDELTRGGVSIAEIGVRDIEMQLAIAANDMSLASEAEGRLSRLIWQLKVETLITACGSSSPELSGCIGSAKPPKVCRLPSTQSRELRESQTATYSNG